jgi:serine/threonine protein kinase
MSAKDRKIEDFYTLEKQLGRGAFSTVRLGINKKTKKKYAIKIINKPELDVDQQKNIQVEIDILKKVKHPHVISLEDIFETPSTLYVVMELVTGGELFDMIVDQGHYEEKDATEMVRRIVSAVEYLHSENIVHRDLKPENLLLKSMEDKLSVKIADFGLSKIVGAEVIMKTACGTPSYVAPEVLEAHPTGYGPAVDMWSIGVITYILLCGFPPFYGDTLPIIFEKIIAAQYDFPAEYWEEVSPAAKEFIKSLLVKEPEKRLTAKQALAHPWLAGQASSTKLRKVNSKLGEYIKQRKSSHNLLLDKQNQK